MDQAMSTPGFRVLTADESREWLLDRLAHAIGEAVHAKDQSINIDGPWLRYPEGNAVHGREDLNLRDLAQRIVTSCTYYI
jgi:hypothetical protein